MVVKNATRGEDSTANASDSGEPVPVIILMGPPGCGKGTQGDRIVKKLGIPSVSTGDLLRDEVARNTELGKKFGRIMAEGGFGDDADVLALVAQKIKGDECAHGFLLDGFPRNVAQADGLQKMLSGIDRVCKLIVFHIDVSDSVVVDRISNRYFCKKCKTNYNKVYKNPIVAGTCDICGGHEFGVRDDDKPEVVRDRLRIYDQQTMPVLEYYRKQNVLENVNGDLNIEAVSLEINNALGKLLTY